MQSRIKVPLEKVQQSPSLTTAIERRKKRQRANAAAADTLFKSDPKKKNKVELTTNQLAYMFNVTYMTIYNWRNTKNLPYYHLPGGAKPPVRYDEGLILNWAEAHGIPIQNEDYLLLI